MACFVYHYPCFDGVFAALAAYLYHSVLGLPAIFLPNSVADPLRVEDFDVKGFHTCYLLDFVGPRGFAIKLSQIVKQVVVLDHHKTAYDSLPLVDGCYTNFNSIMDMNKSGATIAYEYFTEMLLLENHFQPRRRTLVNAQNLDRVELLFRYVEDADLWRWALPDSKSFNAGLSNERSNLNAIANPYIFDQLLGLDPTTLIANGRLWLQTQQKLVERLLDKAFKIQLGGGIFGQCLGVRADTNPDLRSEIGNQLSVRSAAGGLRLSLIMTYLQRRKQGEGEEAREPLVKPIEEKTFSRENLEEEPRELS